MRDFKKVEQEQPTLIGLESLLSETYDYIMCYGTRKDQWSQEFPRNDESRRGYVATGEEVLHSQDSHQRSNISFGF